MSPPRCLCIGAGNSSPDVSRRRLSWLFSGLMDVAGREGAPLGQVGSWRQVF